MTDLTYCYRHMTRTDIDALDTIETPDFNDGNLSDEELEIPFEMIPPNPDDSDTLPSQVHPSYPYGDPTRLTHPASFPRTAYDPYSRALFEDASALGVNANLRWRELALDLLLPIDQEKAEAERAAQARKLASGTGAAQNPPQARGAPPQAHDTSMEEDEEFDEDEDEDEDEGEDTENDENAHSYDDEEVEVEDDGTDPQALVHYLMAYQAHEASRTQ